MTVVGREGTLVGTATSASEGALSHAELERRPRLRPGDLAEYVPGVAATQHSGSGKANQYFLRGFNLDHGTDFAQSVDGMPVNLRSHGHGQGYADLNFLIPELVDGLVYRKGPYAADVGDFSSAGSVEYRLVDAMPKDFAQLEAGSNGYARVVGAASHAIGKGTLTWGIEAQDYDGPWRDIGEDVRKRNALLRYVAPVGPGQLTLTAMGYDNRWNSPDQIPQRAVDSGLIDRLGSIDTTLGGDSSRHSLSGGWRGDAFGGTFDASAYAIRYRLSLWSNFTYFLDDPVRGDQFRQFDARTVTGFALRQAWQGNTWRVRAGMDGRRDDIGRVGVERTQARAFVAPVRDDRVDERSVDAWMDAQWSLTQALRLQLGGRYDRYTFDVDALQPENGGRTSAGIASFKGELAWRVAEPTELYLDWGQGFHSNDARGTTIRVDPVSGDPANRVTPLVRSRGAELGLRIAREGRWQTTLALWRLDLASELLFVGDAGTTEASRPSERRGVELGAYWFADPRARLELEVAYTQARFGDDDPAGDRIPGAVPWVVSAAWSSDWAQGWHSSARVRYLGAAPLIEDDGVRSASSTMVSLAVGKRWQRWNLELDVLNALDSDDHDIEYFYASRLPGEADEGVEGLHIHAFEPRSYRLRATYSF
ncbi:TonB-dependent receptor [Noviluteimonas dokdonensis]|uniref:TonB-dependent receptor n=1 Tax=Noviluteimonas dokdonensis TaxID=414050 RepID=UPI0019298891|nr:TonB-dependent receptor [Lysobacter dokdonensis]